MQIVNKQFKIPKTENLTCQYVLDNFDGVEVVRWAIVEVTEEFYVVDAAVIV